MLYPPPPVSTLLPHDTRMIDARAGLRLEVIQGRLWLTRPGDASDRFVQAGGSIDLQQAGVLIQCDVDPAQATPVAARYRLLPLAPQSGMPVACTHPVRARWRAVSWWRPLWQ